MSDKTNPNDLRDPIAAIDHFSGLDAGKLNRLLDVAEVVRYDEGDATLDPEHSQAIYSFLVEGRWWMRRTVVGTTEVREWTDERPGNWHGGIGLIDKVAPPEVRAEPGCTVLHVPRDALDDLAAGNPHLAQAMLRGVMGGSTMLYEYAQKTGTSGDG